jgi:uncharacterized coiled-coil DUF342 family protein
LQHDYESEIEDLANPKDELKKKIVTLAGTIREWNEKTKETRKSVRKQLKDILDLGLKQHKMEKTELRNLINKIFEYHGIHQSWLRKLLPDELKDTSKTRLSYLQMQEIEKERQRLLQQQASGSQQEIEICEYDGPNGSTVESASYQLTELEPIPSSSVDRQGLETQYAGNDSLAQEADSLLSKEFVTIQNKLSEANKRIERLQEDVRSLSKPFVAKAYLQAADQDIPLVAQIDPVKKAITSIQIDKSY